MATLSFEKRQLVSAALSFRFLAFMFESPLSEEDCAQEKLNRQGAKGAKRKEMLRCFFADVVRAAAEPSDSRRLAFFGALAVFNFWILSLVSLPVRDAYR